MEYLFWVFVMVIVSFGGAVFPVTLKAIKEQHKRDYERGDIVIASFVVLVITIIPVVAWIAACMEANVPAAIYWGVLLLLTTSNIRRKL